MNKQGLITKWIIIIVIVLTAAYFVLDNYGYGISEKEQPAEIAPVAEPDPPAPPAPPEAEPEEVIIEPEETSCEKKADCPQGERCIEGVCGVISDLYQTEGCTDTCNYKNVEISTSDGEEYTLNRGRGSYSYAGAIEWKLTPGPDYCQGDEVPIPITLIKKNSGEVLEQQTIVLTEGETSEVVTHPTIERISFTATIESLVETCT
jgi:hypothetical protein